MRNSFKVFSSSNFRKFQVVKFTPNGFNTALRLNLFSNASPKKDSLYNSILVPVFDNKALYFNFTYKYFKLKWSKFEQKANYYKYVKTPAQFPNFLIKTNYFSNSFLNRRRKRRSYKRRRIRYSVYFKSRFLRSHKSIFRAYQIRSFYGKKKFFRIRKKLLKSLARKKSFKVLFSKYWIRRRWRKWGNRRKNRRFKKKFFFKIKKKFKSFKPRFYFKRRSYKLKVFKFFGFRKNIKRIRYARRYAYRKIRKLFAYRKSFSKSLSFLDFYKPFNTSRKIFKFHFFKKLARRLIKRRYFLIYLKHKLNYKIRSRILRNKFALFRFLGFKTHLLQTYFNVFMTPKIKIKKKAIIKFPSFKFFFYPLTLIYSKTFYNFKFFSFYNILKREKNLKRFKSNFGLRWHYRFYKSFKDFFSIISIFNLKFIPFKFKISKNKYFEKFSSRLAALQYLHRRKLVRNLRFFTYFYLFVRIIQFRRNTRLYRRIIKKLLKFIYRRTKAGRILFFLPFILNKFIYFGSISHINPNIYLRDPTKFNDFSSTKVRKSKFILRNKI